MCTSEYRKDSPLYCLNLLQWNRNILVREAIVWDVHVVRSEHQIVLHDLSNYNYCGYSIRENFALLNQVEERSFN